MKKMQIMKKIIVSFLVFSGILLAISESVVATGRAIVMAPMNQKVILSPGENYQGGFIVSNPLDAESNLSYIADVGSFYPTKLDENDNDDYGGADYESKTNFNQIADWMTIENPTGSIAPGEEITIHFSINVPEDVPAGGQYASILVREGREAEEINGSTAITEVMQMAHVIYAEVAGETREEGSIMNNSIPSFLLNNTLDATSRVKNSGNIHTDAEYTLQVWPMFSDEEICTNEEEPEKSLVLPETERYHAQTCQLPSVGIFRAKQVVKIFGETSIVEKTIIVCPIWLLFIIIFIIFMLIFYFIVKAKNRKKATKKSQTK